MPGIYYVRGHQDFFMLLYPQEGYSLENMRVVTGSVRMDNDGGTEITRNVDGTITVIFRDVTEPLDVMYNSILYTGNAPVTGSPAIWSEGSTLYVQASSQQSVLKIYTLTGQIYKRQDIGVGRTSITLPAGMYIIMLDDGLRQKIVIR
jgi:hypothetical protein